MKRTQVTLFIIVGIIIILVIGFLYSFLVDMGGRVGEPGSINGLEIQKLVESYETSLEGCTKSSLQRGIYLIGQQGGVIYDTQAEGGKDYRGPPRDYDYGEFVLPRKNERTGSIYNVSYGIKRPEQYEYEPPMSLYPFGGRRLVEDPAEEYNPSFQRTFGNFPPPGPFEAVPLCDKHGENKLDDYTVSCASYGEHDSVQKFLERYVEEVIYDCIKEKEFEKRAELDYNVENISATSIFSNEFITMKMDMPVTVTSKDKTVSPDISEVEVTEYTRLKLIHELVDELIEEDINNIFFDIVRDAAELDSCMAWRDTSSSCLKEGMEVSMIRNSCKDIDEIDCSVEEDDPERNANFDNILVIKDKENFNKYGEPYEFYIAIENRYPALDFLYDEEEFVGEGWDYILNPGDKLELNPKGYDPDRDHHLGQGFMQRHYDYTHIGDEVPYHHVNLGEELMDSEAYEETEREATYQMVEEDIGEHTIRVRVCNEGDLCDYQDLDILVVGQEVGEHTNHFEEIDDDFASIEGPYTFSYPEISIPQQIQYYILKIDSPENVHEERREEDYFQFPRDYLSYESAVNFTKNMSGYFPVSGDYEINFSVRDVHGDPIEEAESTEELTVKECLPQRDEAAPYPYTNKTTEETSAEDFIYANHTCCVGDPSEPEEDDWGTFADESRVCYEDEQYGCYDNFSAPYYEEELPEPSEGDIDQDVFHFSFERFCSGDEGMTCTGDISAEVNLIEECEGPCQACEPGGDDCVEAEDVFICNDEYKCSMKDMEGGYDEPGGSHYCKAACNEGVCEDPIDCSCSVEECNAECKGGYYNWSFNRHRICDINDCEWSSHYTHTSCLVYSDNKDDYEEETINIHGESITAEMGFGASTYQVHAYDIDDLPDYVEEIEYNEGDLVVDSTVDNNKYGAVCLGNHSQTDDFTRGCQITICDISGCTETETDECRLPGKQGIVEPDRCYIDNPVCNLDGSCDSDNYDLKPMNPPCPEQDLICTEDGWECS